MKQDSEPGQGLGPMTRDLYRLFSKAIGAQVSRFGLSAHSCSYLAFIGMRGSATPKELSKYFSVRTPTALGVLRPLEAKRLVRRTSDPNDARKSVYKLTPRGVDVSRIAGNCAEEIEEMAVRDLSEEQMTQFREIVRIIRNALDTALSQDYEEDVEEYDRPNAGPIQ